MQSKGTLGSVVAGVIAIFLVIICLFYLSFSLVTNHYENKGEEYALARSSKVHGLHFAGKSIYRIHF